MDITNSVLNQIKKFANNEHFVLADGDLIVDSKFDKEMIDIRLSIKVSKILFLKELDTQTLKGINKYGYTIDECSNEAHDWDNMRLQEVIDAMVYTLKKEQYEKEIAENA